MSGSNLLVEEVGPIRRITLNRPEKLNALDSALVEALSQALLQTADDTDVRVIVIAGAGRSFCAGYDLFEEPGPGSTLDNLTHGLDRLLEVFDHPRPIIAQVHGHCLAGGCDLMMMCDLAVASTMPFLVSPRFDSAPLEGETMRLAGELAVVDPVAMTLTKRGLNRSWEAAGFRKALIEGVRLGAEIESCSGTRTRGLRPHRGRERSQGGDPLA